jgi:hypothetical protein
MGPPSPIDNRVLAARARFDELLDEATNRRAVGDLNGAATRAQVAAALAWHSPTGLFASPRLESLLATMGREIPTGPDPVIRDSGGQTRTVLHVLTTAYPAGGHTRLAWRWIERDDRRVHSVAITRQGLDHIPQPLLEAVTDRGGSIHRIDRAARSLVGRARALAGIAAAADVVVLHTHPFDVVPSLALAGLNSRSARPPTMLLNHADHLFWVGLAVADLVLHLRASGARLSVERRGLTADRSTILPLPLGGARAAVERLDARRSLGYGDADVVALTIASAYKFGASNGPGLLSLVRQAVDRHRELRVLAVGPGGRDDWRAAERTTQGRIRALRNQSDLGPFYGAADVYLDSYPFSSLTSMLEAGQQAIPFLAFSDAGADEDVLAFDDPATDRLPIATRTESAFIEALSRLVEDRATRRELGRRIAEELGMVGRHASSPHMPAYSSNTRPPDRARHRWP